MRIRKVMKVELIKVQIVVLVIRQSKLRQVRTMKVYISQRDKKLKMLMVREVVAARIVDSIVKERQVELRKIIP